MRRFISAQIVGLGCYVFVTTSFAVADSAEPRRTIMEERGYRTGHCYRHYALRKCSVSSDSQETECRLYAFPASSGQMVFELDPKKDMLILGKTSSDIGLFLFRFEQDGKMGIPKAELISKRVVSIDEWLSHQSGPLDAVAVGCRSKGRLYPAP